MYSRHLYFAFFFALLMYLCSSLPETNSPYYIRVRELNAERQRLKEATASSEEKDRTIEDLRRQIEEAQKINREAKELQEAKSKPSVSCFVVTLSTCYSTYFCCCRLILLQCRYMPNQQRFI